MRSCAGLRALPKGIMGRRRFRVFFVCARFFGVLRGAAAGVCFPATLFLSFLDFFAA